MDDPRAENLMSQGERGGDVEGLDEVKALQEEHKAEWVSKIRWRIVECLVDTGTFHAKDLLILNIPPEHKNVPGSCAGVAVKAELMEERTDMPRESTGVDGGKGRKSSHYRITAKGRALLPDKLAAHRTRLAELEALTTPEQPPLFEIPDDVPPEPIHHYESEAVA